MGWRFRRVVRAGPFRVNLSRGGVGGSVGIPGFRFTIAADGRRYITVGIPGTGLYWQKAVSAARPSSGGSPPQHIPASTTAPPAQPSVSGAPAQAKLPWWKQKGL